MEKFEYIAFISYKREDEKLAKRIQKKMEAYSIPTALRKKNPTLPTKVRPVFRDQTDLSGGNLKEEIEEALENSKYLIVICSPRAAKSPWVSKEVQYFINHGREKYIIPFIIDGTPNAKNEEDECFPVEIRHLSEEKEILGININEMGRDAAVIKVIARIFNLRFDTLWQRHERAKRRKRVIIGIIFVVLLLISWYIMSTIYSQKRTIEKNLAIYTSLYCSDLLKNGDAYAAADSIVSFFYNGGRMTLELENTLRSIYHQINYSDFTPIALLKGSHGKSKEVVFSKDYSKFAYCDEQRNIFICNTRNGRIIQRKMETSDILRYTKFSPNGNMIIYSTLNPHQTIILNLKTNLTDTISGVCSDFCVMRDGKYLVGASSKYILKYDLENKTISDSIKISSITDNYNITNITYNDKNNKIVIGFCGLYNTSPTIAILDPQTMNIEYTCRGFTNWVDYPQLLNDSIISYIEKQTSYVYNIHKSNIVDSIPNIRTSKVLFRNDAIYYITDSYLLRKHGEDIIKIDTHNNYISDFDVTNDERYLILCGEDGFVKLYNGKINSCNILSNKRYITNIDILRNYLSISTWDYNVYLLKNDKVIFTKENPINTYTMRGWSQLYDDKLWYFDINDNDSNNVSVYDYINHTVYRLKIKDDYKLYVTDKSYASFDFYNLTIYDKVTEKVVNEITNWTKVFPNPNLNKICFFSAYRDTIFVEDLNESITDTIYNPLISESAIFSHDSRKLAVANQNYTVSLINLDSKRIEEINSHNNYNINYLSFSDDDKYLIFTSKDGSVSGWNINNKTMFFKIYPYTYDLNHSYPTIAKYINKTLYVGTSNGDVFKYKILEPKEIIDNFNGLFRSRK